MSDHLKAIYNACDPYKPATEEYYLDCGTARGSHRITQEFQRHLSLASGYLSLLFSGHIGCGKSSELAQLARTLADPHPMPPNNRYFPILLNVSDYLDDYDVTPIEILLAIVSELAATMRERLKIELKDNYFIKRFAEVKQFFLSEVEMSEGELPLGAAKLKIQRLKRDPDARQKVRNSLEPKMSTMLEEINTVFAEARAAILKIKVEEGEQPFTDLVLILDNLEKIERIAGKHEGLESQRELFLERASQLTGIQAHVIYTVPLRLVRSAEGPQLIDRYGSLFVLPMMKVFERGTRKPFQEGITCLHDLLQKRLGKRLGDLLLKEAFSEEALHFLVTYSGGHIRSLMTFVQNACTYADSIPIPLAAAHRAIQQVVRTYSTSSPEGHWAKLAQLDHSTDQKLPNDDDDYLVMLRNLSVLEYMNGGSEDDPFSLAEPWYAVNPIVRELQKFKTAASTLAKENAS